MTNPTESSNDDDFGVPIPGRILPQEAWAKTAIKKMPPPPIDWATMFGRTAPVVLDLGCGNGRFLIARAAWNDRRWITWASTSCRW
ncbi:hypothetical protein NA78x_005962 [Anatilimnocola sp. NA78]|uniref:hypothetical protein n=1 Tax=Anatilimnocola sp. NA78 TaxID=3415683 RepID=UPI003CE54E9F